MNFLERRKYHRTFHYDHPRPLNLGPGRHEPPPRYQAPQYRDPPKMGSTGGRISSKPLREAFLLNGTNLERIIIEEKQDQNFHAYATRWEVFWSKINKPSVPWSFIPIVDQDIMVVGHIGSVWGEELVFIDDGAHGTGRERVDELLELGSLFVGTEQYFKELQKENYRSLGDRAPSVHRLTKYSVQTDIDGEVLGAEVVRGGVPHGSVVAPDIDPFSLFGDVRTIIRLGFRLLVVEVGVKGARTLVRRVIAKRAARKAAVAAEKLFKGLQLGHGHHVKMGIPPEHFNAMVEAAKETNVIAIFRANKDVAIPLIRAKAPGKPMHYKFKTSAETGALTAKTAKDVATAYKHGDFVVDADLVARRKVMRAGKEVTEELKLQNPVWKLEKGQVIDPKSKLPYVGDYDLLGVAPIKSPGSSVALVPDDVVFGDWTGPWVKKYAGAVNKPGRLDRPRVLHGAQDQYGGNPNYVGLTDDTAYAVFPDGRSYIMEGRKAQEAFYEAIGRKAKSPAPAKIGEPGYPRPVP